ncbi:hypothetical protein ACFPK1_16345 [Actinomycetospora rhizophila]|uniref:Uncharacterized protein n=1 Tax=Actinomycetospora rhizophila TaxID=1416876 RepID=A0ABV9ZFM5_9PSEU
MSTNPSVITRSVRRTYQVAGSRFAGIALPARRRELPCRRITAGTVPNRPWHLARRDAELEAAA